MSGRQITQPPYGDAYAGRGLRVVQQIEEKLDSGGWAAKDISGARWTYRLRAFDEAASAIRLNDELAKSTTDSATGWLDDYVPLGTTAYTRVRWELVEVDGDNADASTPTGKREVVLAWWYDPIRTKPPTT